MRARFVMRQNSQKLSSFSFAELGILVSSVWLLPLFRRRLSQAGLSAMLTSVPSGIDLPGAELNRQRQLTEARNIARIVNGLSRRLPGHYSCLVRSLVLEYLLSEKGIHSNLRIGVRNDDAVSTFGAHAWLECHGEVINDSDDIVSRFTEISLPKGS